MDRCEGLHELGVSLKGTELARVRVEEKRLAFDQKKHEGMIVEREKEREKLGLYLQREKKSEIERFRTITEFVSKTIVESVSKSTE